MSVEHATAEFRAIVSGRVQMVMYRDFAQRHAHKRGISGTVHNLPDGTVEVIAQGERGVLEKFAQDLKKGPLLARVEEIDIEWREPRSLFDTFKIVY